MKKAFLKPIAFLMTAVLAFTACTQQNGDTSEPDTESPAISESVSDHTELIDSSESAENTPDAEKVSEKQTETAAETSQIAPETQTEDEEASAGEAPVSTESFLQTESAETVLTTEKKTSVTEAEMEKNDSAATADITTIKEITFFETETPAESLSAVTPITSAQIQSPLKTFSARCDIPSVWEENGKYCGTCKFTVTNGTDSVTDGWTVKITVPKGLEVTSSWNGVFTLNGTSLTVTNESYNGTLEKDGAAVFGFNFASPEKVSSFISIAANSGAPVIGPNQGSQAGTQTSAADSAAPAEAETAPVVSLPSPVSSGLVKDHGKLSVKGAQLVDKNGNNFQLKGMSTHGLSWFPDFVSEGAFRTLRDDWNANAVRLAMYTAEWNGYCTGGDKASLKKLIDKGVQIASDLGMYIIIDWHILSDGNPQTYKSEALKFFDEISAKYKNYDNVIYEICNEPNGNVSWSGDIKPYAVEVIAAIRKNAPDSVVIVGTPTWSQDIDKAAADPLTESNVLYALHFYAATHTDWLRQRLTECRSKGLPVCVTEFGTCDASGNGANDFGQSKQWLELLDKYGISYMNWNLANKNETSSALKESAAADGNWKEGDLSESGAWIRKWFRGEI